MTDKKPPEAGAAGGDKPKLPPRSGDWQSGLKREETGAYKLTASDTVSDFLVSQGNIEASSIHDRPEGYEPEREPRETVEFYKRRTRFSDLLIALLLSLLAFTSVVMTYNGFGHSWDEALYLRPAERAAAWMVGVINLGDDVMLQHDAVDRHWGRFLDGHDPLHPEVAPVPKLLIGAGLTYLKDFVNDPMIAMRLPHALLFGLTVGLLFLLGTREYGRIGGFAAALMYALMPRVFGHAHIAASETPLTFFIVLTVYCFLVSNRFWPFALFTGVAFGLAVATKVSALMLPIPLMIWGQLYKRRDYASNIFAMAFIAPVIMLAVWPWLWYDGFKRFFAYLLFYLEHQKTAVYYLGRIWGYNGPDAPFYYPLHMVAVVVPVWIIVFMILGLLRALFSSVRRPATILFVVLAACWIGLSMLPTAPRYDGERLFFPAFAFLALVAGGGFSLLFDGVRRLRRRRSGDVAVRETGYVAAIVLLLLSGYGVADLYFSHPNQLNYFNWSVGRAKGAYERGFETSYWGEAVNEEVTDYLNTILKPGDKVKTLALNELAFENLRQWGRLPAKVDFSPDEPPFDYVILQVRQGFMRSRERSLFRTKEPMRLFEAQGVPRIAIYDGEAAASLFPAPPSEETTPTVTAAPEIVPSDTDESTATAQLAQPTTGPLAVLDPLTTQAGVTTDTAVTTAPLVLDLTTTPTEAPAFEDGLSTVAEELLSLEDVPTSAPGMYQGEPPSTGTLLTAPPEPQEDE